WDHAFERLFGRAARVAHILFDLAVFMTFCYPAWQTFLLTFLVLLAIALCLGWWQRRLILAESGAGAEGGLALVESTGPGLELGDDRRAGDPHEPDAAESSS